jgi:7,8-dihydroneopterin aldolase/epimerase/oxygenase
MKLTMWKNTSQCLSIKQIEIMAPIGVFDFEKETKNKFLVSVDLWGNFSKPMHSDNLDDTLDYQQIAELATSVLGQGGDLIEKSAYELAQKISILNFPMTKIKVLIEKINPPMNVSLSHTSYELTMEK